MTMPKPVVVGDLLVNAAAAHPNRPALCFVGEEPITYAQFLDQVRQLSGRFSEMGVEPGDKIAVIGENMPNWGVTYFAAVSMGAVATPILQEFHESAVHHILRHSEARLVVASKRYLHKVESESFPCLEGVMRMDDLVMLERPEAEGGFREAVGAACERLGDAARKLMNREGGDEKAEGPAADSVAVILYTSGTTGHSKGVVLTHGALVSNALAGVAVLPIEKTDRFLSMLPLAHTYECTCGLLVPVLSGSSVHYLQKPPTPKTLLPAMQKVKPTILSMVPLIIEKIYKKRIKPKLSKGGLFGLLMKVGPINSLIHQAAGRKLIQSFGGELRCLCLGGAPLSKEVERFLADAQVAYAIGYGLTETAPLVSGAVAKPGKLGHTGPAMPGVSVRIADPDPKTGEGEILVKGPNVMREYYKAPKDTEATFTDDGWLMTGDLGRLDDEGWLAIRGRLKNVVIGPSGENIYPEEVESVLNGCDYVVESLVYDDGGRLAARIHLDYEAVDETFKTGNMIESEARGKVSELLESIRLETNSKVSTFARLSRVMEQVEPFEKTPTKKIKRFVYLEGHKP